MIRPPALLYYGERILDEDLLRINNEDNQYKWGSFTARQYICPGCGIRYRLAAFDDERSNFVYPIDEIGQDHQNLLFKENHGFENIDTIVIKNVDDVYRHIDNCELGLTDGIYHITSESDNRLLNLVEIFSRFSKSETGFGKASGQAQGILRGECEAYLLFVDSLPVSYIATTSRYVLESESTGRIELFDHDVQSIFEELSQNSELQLKYHRDLWMISDLFTMFDFRGSGFSRLLCEHVISEKGMDTAELPVTIPLTEGSLALFRKLSTDSLLGLMPEGNMSRRVPRNDANILLKRF